jgi:hypothetical protein
MSCQVHYANGRQAIQLTSDAGRLKGSACTSHPDAFSQRVLARNFQVETMKAKLTLVNQIYSISSLRNSGFTTLVFTNFKGKRSSEEVDRMIRFRST